MITRKMTIHKKFPVLGIAIAIFLAAAFSGPALAVSPESAEGGVRGIQQLATLDATVTDLVVFGETPHGLRVDVSFEGRLSGMIEGVMRGIDYSLIRPDGVIEIDVRATILTDDGALISAEIEGNMVDGRIRDTSVRFLTGHPAYQWLHDKIIVGKGWSFEDRLHVRYFIDLGE
jgi:hypothetical protein